MLKKNIIVFIHLFLVASDTQMSMQEPLYNKTTKLYSRVDYIDHTFKFHSILELCSISFLFSQVQTHYFPIIRIRIILATKMTTQT